MGQDSFLTLTLFTKFLREFTLKLHAECRNYLGDEYSNSRELFAKISEINSETAENFTENTLYKTYSAFVAVLEAIMKINYKNNVASTAGSAFLWSIINFYEEFYRNSAELKLRFLPHSLFDNNPETYSTERNKFYALSKLEQFSLVEKTLNLLQMTSETLIRRAKLSLEKANIKLLSSLVITYRTEAWGGGAFFDHYTLQFVTGRSTRISISPNLDTSLLEQYSSKLDFALRYGDLIPQTNAIIPSITMAPETHGLIVITGRARNTKDNQPFEHFERTRHENELLTKARRRGQPVLGICGGSWALLAAWGGCTKSVKNHVGFSPGIGEAGNIVNNHPKHPVIILPGTLLHDALRSEGVLTQDEVSVPIQLDVNSAHWDAPDRLPASFQESARAESEVDTDSGVEVAEDCIEAFSSTFGAPMLGVQWHLEAINPSDPAANYNKAILNYMAQAGDAYRIKRRMLKELRSEHSRIKENMKDIKNFRERIKDETKNAFGSTLLLYTIGARKDTLPVDLGHSPEPVRIKFE